jgi:hypothetical protein
VRLLATTNKGHSRDRAESASCHTDRRATHRRRTSGGQAGSCDQPSRRTALIFKDYQSVDRKATAAADPLRARHLTATRANHCGHQMKEASVRTGGECDLRRLVRATFGDLSQRIRDHVNLFRNGWKYCCNIRFAEVSRMSGRSPIRH